MTNLPPGWEWASFGDVARVASNLVDPSDHPHMPHIAPNHIEPWTGRLLPYSTIEDDGVTSPKHLFTPGQILYSKIRPYLAKVTQVNLSGLCSADMYPIETAIDARYLKWYMLTNEFTREAMKHQGRSVLPKINANALNKLPIPVAPLNEQCRIVAALENYLYRLEVGSIQVETAARKLAGLERSLLLATTTTANSNWPRLRIAEIATVSSGATPKRSRTEYYQNGTIPWITSSQLNEDFIHEAKQFVTKLALSETSIKLIEPGSILMAMYGEGKTRGKISELTFQATTNQACAAITLAEQYEEYRPWVKLFLQANYARNRRLSAGGVQPNLNLGLIKSMQIPLPPRRQRDALLDEVQRQRSAIVRLTAELRSVRNREAELRRALLSDAFSGRLVRQDPNDEPTAKLLEKIKVRRVSSPRTNRTPRAAKTTAVASPIQETLL